MLNQTAPEHASESALLRLEDVSRVFDIRRGMFGDRRSLVAVDHVSLSLAKGASIGLVGESGCGKSTLGRLACGLLAPSAGQVLLEGRPLPSAGADSWAAGRIQMIFQDPFSSLNPRLSVGSAVAEPLAARGVSRAERRDQAEAMLTTVGLGGMGSLSGNVPSVMAKVFDTVKSATGIDLQEIAKGETYDAKVNKNISIDGKLPEFPVEISKEE